MKILLINFEYPPLGGGGGVATKQLVEELAPRHDITVITTAFKHIPRQEISGGVRIIRVPVIGRTSLPTSSLISMLTFVPMAMWAGLRLLLREKFDVINAQFVVPSGIPAAFLAWLFHTPLVVSFIGGDVYDPTKGISPHRHPVLRFLIRRIVQQAAICTAISLDTKRRAQELHAITKEIVVTHLGFVPQHVPAASRNELQLPEGEFICISIGRLIPRKSYPVLLAAFRAVPNTQLYIVGDGPLKNKLINLIKEYSLTDRVHLLGFVTEEKKLQLLRAADMYVSAAEHEGFGIVFLEAMDAGLPLVVVNEGGQTDFLEDKVNALLVEPHDDKALAAAINELKSNQTLRNQMSQINKVKVTDFYLEKTAKRFEAVLQSVVKI